MRAAVHRRLRRRPARILRSRPARRLRVQTWPARFWPRPSLRRTSRAAAVFSVRRRLAACGASGTARTPAWVAGRFWCSRSRSATGPGVGRCCGRSSRSTVLPGLPVTTPPGRFATARPPPACPPAAWMPFDDDHRDCRPASTTLQPDGLFSPPCVVQAGFADVAFYWLFGVFWAFRWSRVWPAGGFLNRRSQVRILSGVPEFSKHP